MSYELKIKAKHLAEEIRIIKFEERKTGKTIGKLDKHLQSTNNLQEVRKWKAAQGFKLHDLQNHRKFVVRPAARRTHLARAYLKGLAYKDVEQTLRVSPALAAWPYEPQRQVKQIADMVNKYGGKCTPECIKAWILKES
jgi:hypothetical protein